MQILSHRVLLAVSECLSFQSSLKLKEERLLCGTEEGKKERERGEKTTSNSSGFMFVLLPKTPKVAKVTEII